MTFTSFSFLLFAAAVIAAYYLVPKSRQWWVLLIASYAFYLTADVRYLCFLVLTTVTTYFTARHMGAALEVQDAYLAEHKKDLSREEKKEYKAKVKSANRVWMIGTSGDLSRMDPTRARNNDQGVNQGDLTLNRKQPYRKGRYPLILTKYLQRELQFRGLQYRCLLQRCERCAF